MKQLIQCFFLSLLSASGMAQTFVNETNVWTYCNVGYNEWLRNDPKCELSFDKYYFLGDTTIDGRTYQKLWMQKIAHKKNWIPDDVQTWLLSDEVEVQNPIYCLGVREEDGRVLVNAEEYCQWAHLNGEEGIMQELKDKGIIRLESNEYILYDFNDEVDGSVIPHIGNMKYLVFKRGEEPPVGVRRETFLNLFFRGDKLAYQNPKFISDPFFPEISGPFADRPFVEEGKVWVVCRRIHVPAIWDLVAYRETFTIAGDTIIGDKVCKKMMYETEDRIEGTIGTEYLMALYEAGDKVFFFKRGSTEQSLLYDFGASEGDTLFVHDGNPEIVNSSKFQEECRVSVLHKEVDNLIIDNISAREDYHLHSDIEHTWVKGIGSFYGPTINVLYVRSMDDEEQWLEECRVGNEILYQDERTDGISSPTSLCNPSSSLTPWYTLSGHRLPSLPTQKGIYIKDGRKVLIK